MGAAWYLARSELGRSWRSTVVLVVLVGLAGGTVLAAVAGARRTYTARDRYQDAYLAADVTVFHPDPVGAGIDRLETLPQVEAAGPLTFFLMRPRPGSDIAAGFDEVDLAAGSDGRWGRDLDRFRVAEGRLAEDDDELALSTAAAEQIGLGLGDRLSLESATPSALAAAQEGGELTYEGPHVELKVVGLVQSTLDVLASSGELTAYLSASFVDTYGDDIATFSPLRLRLVGGQASFPAFSEAATRLTGGDPDLFLESRAEDDRLAEAGVGVSANGLTYFAAIAGIAGLAALGTALSRSVQAPQQSTLAAVGLARRDRALASGLAVLAVAILGTAVAVAVALAASPLFPLAPARQTEPDPGLDLDPFVLGAGGLLLALVVIALGAVLAWRATVRRVERPLAERPSLVARGLVSVGLTPIATMGVRLALEPGRGRTAVPVRPALIAGVVGVGGVVAILVFGTNLVRLVEEPALSGWNWDVAVAGIEGIPAADVVERYGDEVASLPGVGSLAAVRSATADVEGIETQLLGFENVRGSIEPTIIEGRAPLTDAEVAIGSETLRRLELGLGDRIELAGPDGAEPFVVVGRAAVTTYVDNEDPSRGIAFTMDGLDRVGAYVGTTDFMVRWEPGADVTEARQRLEQVNPEDPLGTSGETVPVLNLARVRSLPIALGTFLAFVALVAVGHALVVAVRRRRRDMALLRALGLLPRQVAATVAWQSITLVLVGLVLGIPLGLALGRLAWREVATGLGVIDTPVLPTLGVALVVPAALLLANLLAALPARTAARTRPATILRTE